jgi:hypothetical protein
MLIKNKKAAKTGIIPGSAAFIIVQLSHPAHPHNHIIKSSSPYSVDPLLSTDHIKTTLVHEIHEKHERKSEDNSFNNSLWMASKICEQPDLHPGRLQIIQYLGTMLSS